MPSMREIMEAATPMDPDNALTLPNGRVIDRRVQQFFQTLSSTAAMVAIYERRAKQFQSFIADRIVRAGEIVRKYESAGLRVGDITHQHIDELLVAQSMMTVVHSQVTGVLIMGDEEAHAFQVMSNSVGPLREYWLDSTDNYGQPQ